MKKIFKDLQNLYSWNEFYTKNERFANAEKTKKQIEDYKKKHNITDNKK
jgi:hypothetical protein